MKVRVVLVDDHAIVREGVRQLLQQVPELEIVAETNNGRQAVEETKRLCPDLVVMDINMAELNGMDATRQIKNANDGVKVIGLSAYADKRYVMGMLDAGASAYVHKSGGGGDLIQAVDAVMRGRTYLSPEVAGVVVDNCRDKSPDRGAPRNGSAFTVLGNREREVLQLVAEGRTSKEIAQRLDISVRTVDVHRRNIMTKLDLHNAAELTRYAIREGLTSAEV
jgi:two-component system, NarL family, response regulator LiaR